MLTGRWPVALLFVVLLAPAIASRSSVAAGASLAADTQQVQVRSGGLMRQEPPLPAGQRITAADGDTILLEGDARVRVIRRRPAFVRIIFNTDQGFVVILAENLREPGDSPTRVTDRSYEFNGLSGPLPLPARWEGAVWLEEHFAAGSPVHFGGGMLGVETSDGKIVFRNGGPNPFNQEQLWSDEAGTLTVRFQGMGMGGGRQSFDQEETRAVAQAVQNASNRTQSMPGGMNGLTGSSDMSWVGMGSGGIGITSEMFVREEGGPPPPFDPSRPPAGGVPVGAVRGGGNIAAPQKIHDVAPAMPEAARAARVSGIVILEITIGVDGAVSDARVLRSIPQLDQAAIDAVRQWRYEPLVLNGQPVPVVITVTVPFPPPPQ